MKNNKGFTLIEILAVIIILGIIMIIAIPSISRHIEETRKESYVTTIKNTVKSSGSIISNIDKSIINRETTYYVPIICIKTENGTPKSPYDDFDKAYIVAGWDGSSFSIYFYGRDKSGVGVSSLKKIDELTTNDIEKDISNESIMLNKRIGNTKSILILDEKDCKTINEVKTEEVSH